MAAASATTATELAAAAAAPDSVEVATTAPAPVPVTAPPMPTGVTLRVGDQPDYLKTLLSLSGEDQNLPYTLTYGSFVGGPPMLQAFQADALDAGFIRTTPLIFARAAKLDLVGIAGWASSKQSSYSLVTPPGVTGIDGWADLKGKSVAYQRGTAGEAVLLQALDSVSLKESDVKTVGVSQVSVTATLEGGSATTGLQVEPLTSSYLAANPTAKAVARADQLTDRSAIVIATTGALSDAGKSAALADYTTRVNDIDVRSIDDDTAAAIRRLRLDRKVIFSRGQHLAPTDHIAFASRFGSPTEGHPVIPGIAEHPEVFEIDYTAGREPYKSCGDVSAADRSVS